MALIPPFFLDSVVAIGALAANGVKIWYATGFLYGVPVEEKKYQIYLVTNRHVLKDQTKMFVRFDNASGGTLEFDLPLLDDGKLIWTPHSDPEIDVAIVAINVAVLQHRGAKFSFFHEDKHVLTRNACIESGIAEGDAVFLLGFPMGLVGIDQNYVLVREGAISRIRDCLTSQNKTFLASVQTFPGNSGGPLVTRPEAIAIDGTKSSSKSSLIGVISSYIPYEDVAVSRQTKRPRVTFEENSGLTVVYPVDFIIDCIKQSKAERLAEASPSPTEKTS